ncbi:MAG: NAD(P)H-binding protein [Thermoleophilia bacterium]|nr:NAD(P)H-binding protein [Thermoleophilia bacterium]
MKVLVTGATGFVGPKVASAIADAGHELRVLERKAGKAEDAGVRAAETTQGDMTSAESVRRAVEGCEAVVHLVAIRQGKPEQFERIMIGGTRALLDAAKDAGIRRFVLMSALGTTEETKELVPYYRAKWAQEQDVKGSGIDHVIFRPSFVFGRDGGILPTFRRLARLTPVTPITGPGTQRIQPIWIDDVAQFFARSLTLPQATNRTWELGGPEAVSWNEFWQRLKQVMGLRRPSLHVPMWFMRANAVVTERLPGNIPLTRDLLTMLEAGDNVTADDSAARTFGIELVPLDEQLRRAT